MIRRSALPTPGTSGRTSDEADIEQSIQLGIQRATDVLDRIGAR